MEQIIRLVEQLLGGKEGAEQEKETCYPGMLVRVVNGYVGGALATDEILLHAGVVLDKDLIAELGRKRELLRSLHDGIHEMGDESQAANLLQLLSVSSEVLQQVGMVVARHLEEFRDDPDYLNIVIGRTRDTIVRECYDLLRGIGGSVHFDNLAVVTKIGGSVQMLSAVLAGFEYSEVDQQTVPELIKLRNNCRELAENANQVLKPKKQVRHDKKKVVSMRTTKKDGGKGKKKADPARKTKKGGK